MTTFRPHAFWLFGLSGAGKSTLAGRLEADLRRAGVPVLMLDGDVLRGGLCAGLGFSDADRSENLRRAAEVARLGVRSQLAVIASFITPLESQRQQVARAIGADALSFVFADAPLNVCQARDVKGLYAKARAGTVANMTGVSSGFERPDQVHLTLSTGHTPVEVCAAQLLTFALQRLQVPAVANRA